MSVPGMLLLIAACGCSGIGQGDPLVERTGQFEVTVQSNGQPIRNFERELVHHLSLDRGSLPRLRKASRTERVTVPGKDARGGFQGLKVRKGVSDSLLSALGVRPGDVVTAFGAKRVEADMSFDDFLLSLEAADKETLTLLRRGEVHKVLYDIRPPRDGHGS